MLLLTVAIWGGTFAAGKSASEGAGPLTSALWRFLLAAAVLGPQCALSREGLFPKGASPFTWLLLGLSGLTGLVLYNYFFIKGLSMTGAGRGSVIVTVNPVFIYLGAVLFFGEKLTLPRLLGMGLAVSGTLVVVSDGSPAALLQGRFNMGDLVMLGCIACWSAYSLLGKLVVGRVTPLAANAWSTFAAIAMLVPLTALSGEPLGAFWGFSAKTWAALAFLGILGTALGFTLFYKGILALGPHKAAIFISLVPFFGLLSGALVHGEAVTLTVLMGLALSLAGVALVQKY
ncbi:MAG: DMT family transporter [Deltaproteobacteria bacterium]|jgi:drug/metabolite transporter (DMT)-like permease|nr:DMT family transporter [Deltaproteobacteria bacterium]